jgi:hypothetical protein
MALSPNWLTEYQKTDRSFILTEHHDEVALQAALENPILTPTTRTQLEEFLLNLPPDGNVHVKYTRQEFGRWQPSQYCSTRMWRRIRWNSLPDSYTDIDAISCFPSIVVALCKLHNVPHALYEEVEMYAANKTPYIDSLNIKR